MHVGQVEQPKIDESLDSLTAAEAAAKERIAKANQQANAIRVKGAEDAGSIVSEASEQAAHVRAVEMDNELKLVRRECDAVAQAAGEVQAKVKKVNSSKASGVLVKEFLKLVREDN